MNKFTLTITKINSTEVAGIFSGEVKDTSGNIKTITDGSFTAKFGTAPPTPNTCKLSNIGSYELGNGAKIGGITSFFNAQNQVIKTLLTDSTTQPVGIDYEFNFNYTASQINVSANQYFKLDGGGRITEFRGNADPSVDTSLRVIVTYSYDGSGYLATASLALELFPTQPVLIYNYQWTGSNLAKVTMNFITGEKSVIDYQYNTTPAKGFLAFHSNPEIILFQNAVNFGKNSANIPVKSTWTDYLANGTPDGTPAVSEFKNHVFDTNGYVKSFDITGDGSVYGSEIRHVLSYKCF
ncbi:hypothetical protein [Paraflavitalea speifideaquila]|uniref:hypothetical protein n=1 Tax=Paraflavitalea speifideaquila TaxID=3076558 RepID=UPI0028E25286|nr:hypothetical protein [Paraflavitalea speifideiaquila]